MSQSSSSSAAAAAAALSLFQTKVHSYITRIKEKMP